MKVYLKLSNLIEFSCSTSFFFFRQRKIILTRFVHRVENAFHVKYFGVPNRVKFEEKKIFIHLYIYIVFIYNVKTIGFKKLIRTPQFRRY